MEAVERPARAAPCQAPQSRQRPLEHAFSTLPPYSEPRIRSRRGEEPQTARAETDGRLNGDCNGQFIASRVSVTGSHVNHPPQIEFSEDRVSRRVRTFARILA